MPKADGGVRMVTDFTHLKKIIDRPVHPFPSSAEIMQSIPPDANCFAILDAVHGYFQLALLHQRLLPRLCLHQQLNPLHRRLLPHLQSPVPEEITDAQPASSNMGGLFSFYKEEDPVNTVENVVGGDINDSSMH